MWTCGLSIAAETTLFVHDTAVGSIAQDWGTLSERRLGGQPHRDEVIYFSVDGPLGCELSSDCRECISPAVEAVYKQGDVRTSTSRIV